MGFYEFFNLLKAPGTMNYDRAKPYNEKARGIPFPEKEVVPTAIFVLQFVLQNQLFR